MASAIYLLLMPIKGSGEKYLGASGGETGTALTAPGFRFWALMWA